jgi:hypothetical protein
MRIGRVRPALLACPLVLVGVGTVLDAERSVEVGKEQMLGYCPIVSWPRTSPPGCMAVWTFT